MAPVKGEWPRPLSLSISSVCCWPLLLCPAFFRLAALVEWPYYTEKQSNDKGSVLILQCDVFLVTRAAVCSFSTANGPWQFHIILSCSWSHLLVSCLHNLWGVGIFWWAIRSMWHLHCSDNVFRWAHLHCGERSVKLFTAKETTETLEDILESPHP